MIETYQLFDLTKTRAKKYLSRFIYPWEALTEIKAIIEKLGDGLCKQFFQIKPQVWVHKSAKIFETAFIQGPCIIDEDSQVRHGAFIRGNVLIGKGCVVGNSTEIKNSILFDGAKVPHFNYVGDSILGANVHFGAGVITSNLKSDKKYIFVNDAREKYYTGLKKVGAFVGDNVEIGCNCVLNPGTVIGKNTRIYPLSSVRGYVAPNKIYKSKDEIVEREDYS